MSAAAPVWTEDDYYRSFRSSLPQGGWLKASLITAGIVGALSAGVVGLRLATLDGDPFSAMWHTHDLNFPTLVRHDKLAVLDPVTGSRVNEINVAPTPVFMPVMNATPASATITGDDAASIVAATETVSDDTVPLSQPNVWDPRRCGEGCVAADDAMTDGRDPYARPPRPDVYVDGYAAPYPPAPRPRYADEAPPPPRYAGRPQPRYVEDDNGYADVPPPPPDDDDSYVVIDDGG